ncbi:hypothetical protein ACFFRR_007199 [Megaselia abdita]
MKLQIAVVLALANCVLGYTLPTVHDFQNTERMLKADDQELSEMCDNVSDALEVEYSNFLKTGVESRALKDLTYVLGNAHTNNMMRYEVENMEIQDRIITCTLCRSTMNVMVRSIRNDELERDEYLNFVLYVCTVFNLYTLEVCQGSFDLHFPIIEHVIKSTNITSRDICGVMLQASFCSINTSPSFSFSVEIDKTLEEATEHKNLIAEPSSEDIHVLQLTDIHYDPLYVAGSLAACDEPMCCRREAGNVEDKSLQAGYWTDYRDCDTPRWMIADSFQAINEQHKNLDYIYFTGDVVDHAVWSTSYDYIKDSLLDQYKLLHSSFPNHQLFPCIGNHESQPLNQFAPPSVTEEEFTTKWLYDILADTWISEFGLPEETRATITKGGYYTVVPKKGFRVIALNNNDCYTFNWWLFYDPGYLVEQLQWFHDTLKIAEEAGEHVHVLAHIPSGAGSCFKSWSEEYTRIIERYRNTISGIFNGHTHIDEMNIFYSEKGNYASNVGWNGGSLTPYSYTNPNYRIYICDPKEMQVLDHETWIFNLTEANIHGADKRPQWYKEYSFKEAFGVQDLSPKSIDELFERFARDPELLMKYHNFKKGMSDPGLAMPCGHNCLKNDLCNLAVTTFKNQKRCKELLAIYDATVLNMKRRRTPKY